MKLVREVAAVVLVLLAGTPLYIAAYQVKKVVRFEIGSMDRDFLASPSQFYNRVRMNGPWRFSATDTRNVDFYGRLTRQRAVFNLPYHASGSPLSLSVRCHRFGVDGPVVLRVQGRQIGKFFTERSFPWEGIEATIPQELAEKGPLVVEVDALNQETPPPHLPRDLGVGVDWLEVEPLSPEARLVPPPGWWMGAFVFPLAGFLFLRLTGASRRASLVGLLVFLAGGSLLTAVAPVPTWMGLRRLWVVFPLGGALHHGLRYAARKRGWPLDEGEQAFLSRLFVAAALAHSVLIFLPNHAPPDLWNHLPQIDWLHRLELDRENLMRYSTSMDGFDDGHVRPHFGADYGAPYPPFFYFLTFAASRLYEDTRFLVEFVPVLLGSLMLVAIFPLAKSIWGDGHFARLASLTLAVEVSLWHHVHRVHGPGVLGAFFVLLFFLFLASRSDSLRRARGILALAVVTVVALLSYTASLVQVFLLMGFLCLWLGASRDSEDRALLRKMLGGFALGAVVAFALYYAPYAADALAKSATLLDRETYDPPARFLLLRNLMRDNARVLLNGYPLYVALSVPGLVAVARGCTSRFHRQLLGSAACAYLTMLLLKDPALLPRVFLHVKEDLFFAPVACLLAALWLARLWKKTAGRTVAAGVLLLLAYLEVRDQALNANTLVDQPVTSRGGKVDRSARAPETVAPTTRDPEAFTAARIELLESSFDPTARKLRVKARLANTGETAWFHQEREAGWVTVALRSEPLGAADFCEALPRHKLVQTVPPGDDLVRELEFYLPRRCVQERWYLDLVNEGYFWLSERGTAPVEIRVRLE